MIGRKLAVPFFCFILMVLCSCKDEGQDADSRIIADVGEAKLYLKDISGMVNEGVSKEDSVAIVERYINSWVKEQLMLQKAKINLTEEQQNFEKQLQKYKNSLLIYTFEEKLLEQKLDTSISETDIEIFYANNKSNFELKENIVQFKFIKVALNAPNLSSVEEWFFSKEEEDQELLNEYFMQFAEKCSFDTSKWVSFQSLLQEIPVKTDNPAAFLESRNPIQIEDSSFRYILVILDHRIKSSISPISFVREKIKAIILKRRRIQLLSEIRQEVFEEGTIKNRYTIY